MKIETSRKSGQFQLSRNLLLFFEENEDPNNISSNLVRLFVNRLTIEEEKQYEIFGTFNLSKVLKSSTSTDRRINSFFVKDYLFDDAWRIHSKKMFQINWRKDIEIILNAFGISNASRKNSTDEMHIVIGTSIYMDKFNSLLHNLFSINSLNNKMGNKMVAKGKINKFTLLNGWKKDFATKNQVRQDYFDSEKKYRDASSVNYNNPIYTSSVNDDFENMISHIFNPDPQQLGNIRERPEYPEISWIPPKKIQKLREMIYDERNSSKERVKTFLYKMLNDDEIDTQQSKEFEFMRSDCERLTVSLRAKF